jgi:hypothetical protein
MKKYDYLKLALRLNLHAKKAWVVKAFSVTKETVQPTAVGSLVQQPWGYSFVNEAGELEKIDDGVANQALFTFAERITVDNSWVPNIEQPAETSIGNVLFNFICILSSFGPKHPFVFGKVSVSALEDVIAKKLQDTPVDESKRSTGLYYVDEYVKFVDSLQYISGFSQLATISATRKNITAPPGIEKFKKELIAKYGDTINDPVVLARFEAELLAYDDAYLKDDPSNGVFTSGKIKHTARKKMFLALGAPLQFSQGQTVTAITNSLEEGWPTDPKNFAAAMNDSRVGSYSRGAETVKGGVSAKYLLRAANNFKIVDTDCGSKLGLKRKYTKENVAQLEGRYVVLSSKVEFVENIQQANNYLNQEVTVRSPMYCKLSGDNICKVCAGKSLSQYPTGLTIPLTEVSNVILTASLKAMHQNTTATAKLNLAKALS